MNPLQAFRDIRVIRRRMKAHPLASRNFRGSFRRWVRWQIASRAFPEPMVVPCVNETRLLVKNGWYGATGEVFLGLTEFEDMSFCLHFLRPDDLFFDIGGNVGVYTVLASGAVGARTVCFEPIPATFRHLLDNLALNGLRDKVVPLNLAVGAEQGKLVMTTGDDVGNHALVDGEEADSVEIPLKKLDSIAEDHGDPILMKIDVEGFEPQAISGAAEILKRQHLLGLVVELNGCGARYGFDDEATHRCLLDHGFNPYVYHPFERRLEPRSGHGDKNTIYLRDPELARERLRTAPAFQVGDHQI